MFTKKTSTRIILRNLLWAILAVAVATGLIFFASGRITKLANSLAEKKRAALYLQKRSQALAALRGELGKIGGNTDKLERVFPRDDNINEFLSVLQDVGHQNGITPVIQAGTPVSAISEGNLAISAVPLSISANGTVVTLTKFLAALEALPYLVSVRGISITASPDWEGSASISIQAQLYAKQT